jgi:DsbC/DsbD-like thiol-disulfide interchange protein/cytochrome c biogenesis protein CcdA
MIRWLLLLLGLLLAQPATAQLGQRENAIRPELVIESHAASGGEAELAIIMHTKPGWHGYWLNPGDAGLPMSVDWTLPNGWQTGPLRYPVPSRLTIAGIMNYVYERDFAVLAKLKVPPGTRGPQRISARMRWLACTDKVCVPESGDVSLDVPTDSLATPDARFNGWRRALPQPLSSPARFAVRGERIEVAIPLPASVNLSEPYFYPADDGPIDYSAAQGFRRDGDTLIAELKRRRGSPRSLSGVLSLGEGRGLQILALPGAVPEGGEPITPGLGAGAILLAVLGALAGGLLLNLMPCVFPILALKAMHLAKSGGDERSARRDALGYATGAIVGTAMLGVALLAIRAGGSAAGWAFQLQDPRTTIILLLLATAITLNLLRVFELPVLAGEASPAGSFGTGALAAFVATPCAGPFLGVALGTALLLPAYGSLAVFAALGLGLAIPFLLIAFVPALRQRLPRPGPWMARLQQFLALPMAATAAACLWLLSRQAGEEALLVGLAAVVALIALLYWIGRRQRGGARAGVLALAAVALVTGTAAALVPPTVRTEARIPLGAGAWSNEAVRAAQEAGRPAFVYFTADWCLSCKANEAVAIEREETKAAFEQAGVRVLVGDWTNGDPMITRFLESRGRAGVPLYLWYEPGTAEPEELPQVLTPSMLSDRARRPRR